MAGTADDLTAGEAYYMTGNLTEAAGHLTNAAAVKTPSQAQRALYLLGRISLLTGDFRQAKEYFERSAEQDSGRSAGRWMALAGIGDALYASGRYEEAVRRYRIAFRESGQGGNGAVINLRIALCEYALGMDNQALDHLDDALSRVPVLSGWVGRAEEFHHSMVMVGAAPPGPAVTRVFVLAGPLTGDFRVEGISGPDIPMKEIRKDGATYLEFGPLTDPVEAMILMERIRSRYPVPVETIKR